MRATDSNACERCPDHGSIRVDAHISMKLCARCWGEWKESVVRAATQLRVRSWLMKGHAEAAPRNIREEEH